MHKHVEQSFVESRNMQSGEFPAPGKAMFVYRAFVFAQEMTGDLVDQHEFVSAFFQVLRVEFVAWLTKMGRKPVCFLVCNHDHQAFATIAAGGTIDLWGDFLVEPGNKLINCFAVLLLEKDPETIIFGRFLGRNGVNPDRIGFNMVIGRCDGANVSAYPYDAGKQLVNRIIHI